MSSIGNERKLTVRQNGNGRSTQSVDQIISLDFKGFWKTEDISDIPDKSGIYIVYETRFYPHFKHFFACRVIYIGEASDFRSQIASHDRRADWEKLCGKDRQLCFSFAEVSDASRKRALAAMIYEHKPPLNDRFIDEFPFDDTIILAKGRADLLHVLFKVRKSPDS